MILKTAKFAVFRMLQPAMLLRRRKNSGRTLKSSERSILPARSLTSQTEKLTRNVERPEGAKGFTSSPWASDCKVLCLDETGLTVVLKARPGLEVLTTNKLDEMSWSSAAVMSESLLLRGVDHPYRIAECVFFDRPTHQPDTRDSYLFRLRSNKDHNTINGALGCMEVFLRLLDIRGYCELKGTDP